jgi:hypothetical protein
MRIIYINVFRFCAGLLWMHFDPSSRKELACGTASVCVPSKNELLTGNQPVEKCASLSENTCALSKEAHHEQLVCMLLGREDEHTFPNNMHKPADKITCRS